ncbi:ArnT family glycosyltransferase [Rothia kristinae]|uniref:ArnT family glycosyltransferase n=1 Tax=Rothia kristinae TaxID=37923 RepID=UPI002F2B90E0
MATQSLPKRPARSPRIARSRRFRRHDDVVEPPTATTARVRWSWPAWLLLAVTAAAYLWNLGANGWGNGFYAAAAQAGADNWEAFLFGSSDIGNSITVDKPPASLWPMALSVKLFGLSTWSLMVPEVLMGVASVALVYASVARAVGRGPGLLAGYALAATPVAALMFRYDNPEALLLLLMSLAAYATVRAIDSGRIRWMVLCGAALGFAFLTKQLQGLLVVPGFGLAYLVLARGTLRRRLAGLAAALAALVVAAGWWVALVMLTPASDRPYIGGSQTNSFWDLTFGYNGLGRISGEETGSVGGGATASPTMFRMFDSSFGGQISWLMPAAIILTAAALWITRRAARTDRRRATLVVWGSWFLTTWVVFSIMQGIQHAYYSVALAPAIAAMIGTGAAIVWDAARAERWFARDVADTSAGMSVTGVPEEEIAVDPQTAPLHRADVGQAPRREAPERVGSWREALAGGTWQFAVLGFCTAITGVWAFVLLGRDGYLPLLRWMILFLALISGAALAFGAQLHRQLLGLAVAGAVLASLAGPTAYTAATLSTGHTGSIITAGAWWRRHGRPGGGGGGGAAAGGGPGGIRRRQRRRGNRWSRWQWRRQRRCGGIRADERGRVGCGPGRSLHRGGRDSTGRRGRCRRRDGRRRADAEHLRAQRRADQLPLPGRGPLPVDAGGGRLQQRRRVPAGLGGVRDAGRRVQRDGPRPHPGGVPEARGPGEDPLLHRRDHQLRDGRLLQRIGCRRADRRVGAGPLHLGDGGRHHGLRPHRRHAGGVVTP